MARLKGKVAVVTGASKGIGAAIAERFGEEGASVVVHYGSDKKGAEKVVAAIEKAGSKAVAVQGDLSKPDEVSQGVRGGGDGVRQDRRAGEQRRGLRFSSAAADRRGALPQALRFECAGAAAGDARGGEADGWRRAR